MSKTTRTLKYEVTVHIPAHITVNSINTELTKLQKKLKAFKISTNIKNITKP